MNSWIDTVMVLLVLSNLLLVSSRRLALCVNIIALEGLFLACLPPLVENSLLSARPLIFALVIVGLKVILIPSLLRRAIHKAGVENDIHPYLGHTVSIVIAALAFIGARMLSAKMSWPVPELSALMSSVAFFTIFCGLFLIVSRRQAISQVIGYLQLEYGIFIFGMTHPYQHSFLVEIAVLLDLFAAVLVMGIAIYQINKEFDHIDTARLSVLRDFKR